MEKLPGPVLWSIASKLLLYNDYVAFLVTCKRVAAALKRYEVKPRLVVAINFQRWLVGNVHGQNYEKTVYRDTYIEWWYSLETRSVRGYLQWCGRHTFGWYHISGQGSPKVSLLSPRCNQPPEKRYYALPTCFPERDGYLLNYSDLCKQGVSFEVEEEMMAAILEHEQVMRVRDEVADVWEYNFWALEHFWHLWRRELYGIAIEGRCEYCVR